MRELENSGNGSGSGVLNDPTKAFDILVTLDQGDKPNADSPRDTLGYRARLLVRKYRATIAVGGVDQDVKVALKSLMRVMTIALARCGHSAYQEIPRESGENVGEGAVDTGSINGN